MNLDLGKQSTDHIAHSDVEPFLESLACAPESALLLDYDGTLAPFRVQRDQAVPYPGVPDLLQAIEATGRTRIYVVTGRPTDDIVALLGLYPSPEIWGLHGMQRRKKEGTVEMACVSESLVQALIEADRWLQLENLRRTAEFKPGSIAVHWRGLPEDNAADIEQRVMAGWSRIAQRSGIELLHFDGGVELRTPELDKGDAVRQILEQLPPGAPVAYLGDDETDEHAFQALGNRGLRVLVRSEWRETEADHWLKPPEQLLDFLQSWLQAVQVKAVTVASATVE